MTNETETPKPKRLWRLTRTLTLWLIRMPAWCIALLLLIGTYTWGRVGPTVTDHVNQAYASVPFLHDEYEVPLQMLIKPNDLPIETLACSIAEQKGIKCDLILAIIEVESANGTQLTRYEPTLFDKWERDRKYLDRTANERRSLASSHGLMHILGSTSEEFCSKPYSAMYDNEENLRCGIAYLLSCFQKTNDPWEAVRCYNGTGPGAVNHANRVFAALGRRQNKDLIVLAAK